MGTPAIIEVLNEEGGTIVQIYLQCDGYPSWAGKRLAEYIGLNRTIVNGIGAGMQSSKYSNGMGDLAARLAQHFKNGHPLGHCYLVAPGTWYWDYKYRVIHQPDTEGVSIDFFAIDGGAPRRFSSISEFLDFCERYQDE